MCKPGVRFFSHTVFKADDPISTTHSDGSATFHLPGSKIDLKDDIVKVNVIGDTSSSFREIQVTNTIVTKEKYHRRGSSVWRDQDLHALYPFANYEYSDWVHVIETYHVCPANQDPRFKS